MRRQSLFDRYTLRDAAIKVVGVGSVGTLCWVLLLTAGEDDPLFLQVKEARASVLEPYVGASLFANHELLDGVRRPEREGPRRASSAPSTAAR